MHVQYVTDDKGKKRAVQLTLKQWNDLQKEVKKLELFEELKQAYRDVVEHQKGNLKTPSTKQLLAEL